MLKVTNIHTYYGLSHILFDVSLEVKQGQVACLLGRNGAGKTTTLKSIMGLVPPRRGRIMFKGEDVTGMQPYILARKGIGYVPDDRRIFADLSVKDNLEIAARKSNGREQWTLEKVYDLFPSLKAFSDRKGSLLSGGEQKMLAIGRALMTNPELLLLDEPTEGLAPLLVKNLRETIEKLKAVGLTVLLAEQNVKFILRLSDYGYIIDDGRICYQGTVSELVSSEELRRRCGI
ncbi:MAG: ABC transporter ATP-binding protein [Deltaproteobacteria bacterium]|nr:MAG: ABC transporter ATP-binding protein [Deltaproteobacteria bacterium]